MGCHLWGRRVIWSPKHQLLLTPDIAIKLEGIEPWVSRSGRSPGEGNGNTFQGKPHGQKSPAGYSPWGPKELDMISQLNNKMYILFPFSLSDSLYLKGVSCRQHIVGSTLQ